MIYVNIGKNVSSDSSFYIQKTEKHSIRIEIFHMRYAFFMRLIYIRNVFLLRIKILSNRVETAYIT